MYYLYFYFYAVWYIFIYINYIPVFSEFLHLYFRVLSWKGPGDPGRCRLNARRCWGSATLGSGPWRWGWGRTGTGRSPLPQDSLVYVWTPLSGWAPCEMGADGGGWTQGGHWGGRDHALSNQVWIHPDCLLRASFVHEQNDSSLFTEKANSCVFFLSCFTHRASGRGRLCL